MFTKVYSKIENTKLSYGEAWGLIDETCCKGNSVPFLCTQGGAFIIISQGMFLQHGSINIFYQAFSYLFFQLHPVL